MDAIVALIAAGKLTQARAALEADPRSCGGDAEMTRLLARLRFHQGDASGGLELLERLPQDLAGVGFERGVMCLAMDRADAAEAAFRRELANNPGHADSWYNLSWILRRRGDVRGAVDALRLVLELQPGHGAAAFNLGNALLDSGAVAEAVAVYDRLLASHPETPQILANLGAALVRLGERHRAEIVLRRARALDESLSEALTSLAFLLLSGDRLDEAVAMLMDHASRFPADEKVGCALGQVLLSARRLSEAQAALERVLAHAQNSAACWNLLGAVLIERNQLARAEQCLEKALELDPSMAEAHANLAMLHAERGEDEAALTRFRRARDLAPEDAALHSNFLFYLRHRSRLTEDEIAAEHFRFGRQQEEGVPMLPHAAPQPQDANRRLRIGYVSPDFRDHAVTLLFEPILAARDRDGFEVFCYHNKPRTTPATKRLMSQADHWRSIVGMTVDQAARTIHADGIDILVDLAGHTDGNALPVFARKPAPVQITWLGYPGTTGLTRMDYRITDSVSDPPGMAEGRNSEVLLRLRCHPPILRPPCVAETPSVPKSRSGRFTFGSFNKPIKMGEGVFAVWSRILLSRPDADLLLLAPGGDDPVAASRIVQRFVDHGIAADRIRVMGHRPLDQYLKIVQSVDIALDSFPYSGATTTMMCLWMGVPVVAMEAAGAHSVSPSLLQSLGLGELVARNEDDYVAVALGLAVDRDGLDAWRQTLPQRMAALASHSVSAFTASYEQTLRQIWRCHVHGERWQGSTVRDDGLKMLSQRSLAVVTEDAHGSALRLWSAGASSVLVCAARGDLGDPRFSPDGRRLAFSRRVDGFFQVFVMDLRTGECLPVSGSGRHNLMPEWSRDGDSLAWHGLKSLELQDTRSLEIYRWEPHLGEVRLTSNDDADLCPVFDGTGRLLFLHVAVFGQARLCRLDAGRVTALELGGGNHSQAHEAGGLLAMASAHDGTQGYGVVVADAQTGAVRWRSDWTCPTIPMPRFSPAGDLLAFSGPSPWVNALALYMQAPDGSQARVVGGPEDFLALPRWSADGQLVAVEDRRSGGIAVADRQGRVGAIEATSGYCGERFLQTWNFDLW